MIVNNEVVMYLQTFIYKSSCDAQSLHIDVQNRNLQIIHQFKWQSAHIQTVNGHGYE